MNLNSWWANYFATYWSIGIPIGAIIVLWRLKNNLYRAKDHNQIHNASQEGLDWQQFEA